MIYLVKDKDGLLWGSFPCVAGGGEWREYDMSIVGANWLVGSWYEHDAKHWANVWRKKLDHFQPGRAPHKVVKVSWKHVGKRRPDISVDGPSRGGKHKIKWK